MTDPLSGPSSGARHEDSHPARDDGPHRLRVGFDRDRSIHDGRELDTGGPEGPGHILSIDRALSIADEIEPVAEEVEPGPCRLRPRFRAVAVRSSGRTATRTRSYSRASVGLDNAGRIDKSGRPVASIPPRARSMRPGAGIRQCGQRFGTEGKPGQDSLQAARHLTSGGVSSIPWGKDRGCRRRRPYVFAAVGWTGVKVNSSSRASQPISTVSPSAIRLLEQGGGQRVGQPLLDDPLERPGPVGRVEALLGQPRLGLVGDAEGQPGLGELASGAGGAGCRRSGSAPPSPAGGR